MAYFSAKPSMFVKAFIISDAFLYASLNVVNILFAVYVTSKIAGGTIQTATIAIVSGFIARILVDLFAGKYISNLDETAKVWIVILGMGMISLSYFGFTMSTTIIGLSISWMLGGAGWGLALPTKLSLAANHINPAQANQEWGLTDAINMSLIALTMITGSYIVTNYSYGLLFIAAGMLNFLGLIPYIAYLRLTSKAAKKA